MSTSTITTNASAATTAQDHFIYSEETQTLTFGQWVPSVSKMMDLHVGWTEGDGSGNEGYCVSDYFDDSNLYRGADQHGIEPKFSEGPTYK